MQTRIFIVAVSLMFIAIIIGLIILLLRQPKNTAGTDAEEDKLEIAGVEDSALPSGLPDAVATPTPTRVKTSPPPMTIDKSKKYSAVLETSLGSITIAFNAKETPITVNNFITLARRDFYDDTIFHRVISGFMIQGGDPRGDGTGGPGYTFADEPFSGEYVRGTVAMANSGPDTNGSQFFIMHEDSQLPKNYVIFGEVTEGLDVVDAITNAEVTASRSGEQSKPVEPVTIVNVKIVEE